MSKVDKIAREQEIIDRDLQELENLRDYHMQEDLGMSVIQVNAEIAKREKDVAKRQKIVMRLQKDIA